MSKSGGHYTLASPTPNSVGTCPPGPSPKVYASGFCGGDSLGRGAISSVCTFTFTFNLLDKIAQLDMPDEVYNWMVNFFSGHSHCIHHIGEEFAVSEITAGIVQGSSIGPASYVVNTADRPESSNTRKPNDKICRRRLHSHSGCKRKQSTGGVGECRRMVADEQP